MKIIFSTTKDRLHFHSLKSDHCDWLGLYKFKVIDDVTIYLDNSFMNIIDYNYSKEKLKKINSLPPSIFILNFPILCIN